MNLNSDAIYALLTNTAPGVNDATVDTTTSTCTINPSGALEIAAGNGYTKGGVVIGSSSFTQASGIAALAGNYAQITATGNIGPYRYIVFYDNSAGTTSTRPIVGWADYGSSVTQINTQVLTIESIDASNNWTAANPLLTITS